MGLQGGLRAVRINGRGKSQSGVRPNILVVEGTRTFTTIMARRFERDLNVEVTTCQTLAEMRALVKRGGAHFALAVIDPGLADSQRGQVLEFSAQAEIPTIVFTRRVDASMREGFLNWGVLDYVIRDDDQALDGLVRAAGRILANRNIRVLVADGFAEEESEAVRMLKAQQFVVLHACDAGDCMQKLARHGDVELVMIDYALPGGTGVDLVKQIRRNLLPETIRLIGFSSQAHALACVEFLKAGVNDFLYRPFVAEEFQCRVAQSIETLEEIRALRAIASCDFLTDTYNRRHFFERGPVLVQRCLSRHEPCCAAVLDIDHFKKFNDTYGHEIGDMVLKLVARKLRELVDEDVHLLARLGGEEFAILLRNMGIREATDYCNMLREEIARTSIAIDEEALSVQVSIGVAEISADEAFENYLHAADQYLYMAKNSGRNRVFSDYSITQLFAARGSESQADQRSDQAA